MNKNHLAEEISPYLLQHKDNPVHWYPWGPSALSEAKKTNKPILLSIGYAACHWCHVMAHESFEDAETAAVMNDHYVNIKVDREERPDIDKIYMNAIHLMGEQGGWPLTMFLTPEGHPFWGGTYFPKTPAYGRPSFIQVLEQISQIYQTQPDKVETNAQTIKQAMEKRPENKDNQTLSIELIDQIAHRLLQQIDFTHGGLKGAPKFPQTLLLEFLWRVGARFKLPEYTDAVTISLTQMSQGGIYDHLGGGYSRYSVDALWLAPHFEKMLYDNALIVDQLLRAYQVTEEPLFRLRIEETIQWIEREMLSDQSAFHASLDADSEGVEGKFYVWTAEEIRSVLQHDYEVFAQIYDVTPDGNWEGSNILNRLQAKHLENEDIEYSLKQNRQKLLKHRSKRIRPGLDDKILSDWNGLMIATLATAATVLDNSRWLQMAKQAFHYIATEMILEGKLHHAARMGKVQHLATSEGYANMITASLNLHRATNENAYLEMALTLNNTLYDHYWDETEGGYFFTADIAETLIIRSRSASDDATPNANGIMVQNLIRLFLITGEQTHLDRADRIIAVFTPQLLENIFSSTSLLIAFESRMQMLSLVFATGEEETLNHLKLKVIRAHMPAYGALIVAETEKPLPQQHPAYGKKCVNAQPTLYICNNNTCSQPLVEEEDIIEALKSF